MRTFRRLAENLALGFIWILVFSGFMVTGPNLGTANASICGTTVQHNVQGWDSTQTGRGNWAHILVNNINFSTLTGPIFRSLFVIKGTGPLDMETGWLSANQGQPRAYYEIVDNAGDHGAVLGLTVSVDIPDPITGYTNVDPANVFKESAPGSQLPDGNWAWTFTLNGGSASTLENSFHIGNLRTNSERHCNGDALYAKFTHLDNCSTVSGGSCVWHGSYYALSCFKAIVGTSSPYHYEKTNNTQQYVKTGLAAC